MLLAQDLQVLVLRLLQVFLPLDRLLHLKQMLLLLECIVQVVLLLLHGSLLFVGRQLAFDTRQASFHHRILLENLSFIIIYFFLFIRLVDKIQEHLTAFQVIFPILVLFRLSVAVLSFVEVGQLLLPSLSLLFLHLKLSLVVLDVYDEG